MLIHIVADYGHGDLAFAEVEQRLALHFPGAFFVPTPVPPFDTLAAGFCIAQLALNEGPADRLVFHNVAPRRDESGPREEDEGERLVALELHNGVRVVGPNAGSSLSFLRDEAAAMHYLEVPAAGSQFRSRDFFPAGLAAVARADAEALGAELPRDSIPPVPEGAIVYADGYGNLKTSWTEPPAAQGERVLVTVERVKATAVVSDGTFEVPEGELSFAPGSSGWPLHAGGSCSFYELFLRGGSAAARFGHPPVGARVRVDALG